jgi:hypothetical protein
MEWRNVFVNPPPDVSENKEQYYNTEGYKVTVNWHGVCKEETQKENTKLVRKNVIIQS